MNAERRKDIALVLKSLEKWKDEFQTVIAASRSDFDEMMHALEDVHTAEGDAYDNLPEGVQSGERGDKMQAGLDALEEAKEKLESLGDDLEEWIDEQLTEVKEALGTAVE